MKLSGRDFAYLRYIERWATYKASEGALSLRKVIHEDNGRYFSSILREDDTIVHSFNINNLPKADGMLILGYPKVLAYAAEVAVKYREKYGEYPELFSVGDGRGMFAQRRQMDKWFAQQLVALGFPSKWAFKNCCSHTQKNRDYIADVQRHLAPRIPLSRRLKILLVTGAGCSLCATQELSEAMPYAEFLVFETPQPASDQRFFDSEQFAPNSYGVDILLAQVVRSRLNTLSLPVEKLLEIPRIGFIRDLLMKGYAGCFSSDEMWECIGIDPEVGRELHQARLAQLQRLVRPIRFEKQQKRFILSIKKRFERKGLIITT